MSKIKQPAPQEIIDLVRSKCINTPFDDKLEIGYGLSIYYECDIDEDEDSDETGSFITGRRVTFETVSLHGEDTICEFDPVDFDFSE